jgi:excisionase family DNA binding protein
LSIFITTGGLSTSTDGWPLTYPSWFSALDRRSIDDALSAASTSATLPATPAIARGMRVLTGPLHGRLFASEIAAAEAVLQVFPVIVRVLSTPHDGGPDDDTRHRVADQLFAELVVWIADLTPSVTAVDGFADRVRDARETCAWWTEAFAAPASAVSAPVPAATPNDDDSPLLTLKEAAAQLKLATKTLRAMGVKGDIHIIQVGARKLRVRQAEVNRLLAQNKYQFR